MRRRSQSAPSRKSFGSGHSSHGEESKVNILSESLDPRLLEAIGEVRGKRPRTVVDHILEHGSITTDDLKNLYGYNHPPRAARDVREAGIPLDTFRVRGDGGRLIAAYRFGDPWKVDRHKLGGRRTFSTAMKTALYERARERCDICSTPYASRFLQIDHRVPYEVAGDSVADEKERDAFLLLCASCRRAKSWTCEHCPNVEQDRRSAAACTSCYWASPTSYTHVGLEDVRRLDRGWAGDETIVADEIMALALANGVSPADFAKTLLANSVTSLKED